MCRRSKIIDMDVGVWRRRSAIIIRMAAHHNWQHIQIIGISSQSIDKEFFRYIISTIGIFERQIEFVITIQRCKTFLILTPRTFKQPATINRL